MATPLSSTRTAPVLNAGQKAQKAARKRFNASTLAGCSSELRKSSFEGRIEFFKQLGYSDLVAIQKATLYYSNIASTYVAAQGASVVSVSFDEHLDTDEYTISVIFYAPAGITLVEPVTFLNY